MREGTSIGILGGGNMGEAIIKGLTKSRMELHCFDINKKRLEYLKKEYNIIEQSTPGELVSNCDVLILAVKPAQAKDVLSGISKAVNERSSLLISIAAGLSLEFLQKHLDGYSNIIRVMPNTPCLVLEGASVLAQHSDVNKADMEFASEIFGSLGKVLVLDEALLDAVTGLSGSGPAYIFLAIDAMASGGVKMGLSRQDSIMLAAQTVLGAAKMVLETGIHPEELRDRVSSPAGTTIAGIHTLERSGFRSALMDAVESATQRSKELGRRLGC